MKTTTVYRIEDQNGAGPYTNGHVTDIGYAYFNAPDHQCGPNRDAKLSPLWNCLPNVSSYYFGFKTKRQLKAWFPHKDLLKLAALGSTIFVYKVPADTVILGDKQLIFRKRDAVTKTQEPICRSKKT